MIDFDLTKEQCEFRDSFRSFASSYLRPFAVAADLTGELPHIMFRQSEILTAMQAFLPIEFGGGWQMAPGHCFDIARDPLLKVIMNEEAGYSDASLFISLPGPGLTVPIVDAFGTSAQKKKLFATFNHANQGRWAAFAMTEPSAGSDFTGLKATAVEEKDGYVLNGTKWFVGNGLRAEWVIVFASTNPKLGRFGIKAFIVERGTPGFEASRILDTMGFRSVQVSELKFVECRIPKENLLCPTNAGKKGGFDGSLLTLQQFRPAIAALAVGTARAALEEVEQLVSQNGASHFRAVNWRKTRHFLDTCRVRIHAARLLCWKAAWIARSGGDSFPQICMAKAFAAKIAMEVCSAAMEIAGVAAFRTHPLIEKLHRDAKAFDLLEGTGDMQRLMLAKAILRKS